MFEEKITGFTFVTAFRYFPIFSQTRITGNRKITVFRPSPLRVGHFTTVSGHIFANYINNFHKTEDLTIILRCPTLKNDD